MSQRLFFVVVFIIQAVIAIMNYLIAMKHYDHGKFDAMIIDILCGVSWTATAFYKLWEATLV